MEHTHEGTDVQFVTLLAQTEISILPLKGRRQCYLLLRDWEPAGPVPTTSAARGSLLPQSLGAPLPATAMPGTGPCPHHSKPKGH